MAEINKTYGPNTVVLASDILVPERITTGSFTFDCALGGGWPVNQWHEIIGNPSAGKTATLLKTIAANQTSDPNFVCIWIASEYFDKGYARLLGVDIKRVVVINESIMENCFQQALKALEQHVCDMLVIDSLPSMVPGEEAEKQMDEFTTAMGARLTNKFFRKQGTSGKRSMIDPTDRACTCFIINQWRMKIGITFGDPRTSPGGQGKDYSFFTRVEVRRGGWLTTGTGDKKVRVGQIIQAQVIKNKSFAPHKVAAIPYYFEDSVLGDGGSYDVPMELANMALAYDLVAKSGSWYSWGEVSGQGLPGFSRVLAERPEDMARMQGILLDLAVKKQLAMRDVEVDSLPIAPRRVARRSTRLAS